MLRTASFARFAAVLFATFALASSAHAQCPTGSVACFDFEAGLAGWTIGDAGEAESLSYKPPSGSAFGTGGALRLTLGYVSAPTFDATFAQVVSPRITGADVLAYGEGGLSLVIGAASDAAIQEIRVALNLTESGQQLVPTDGYRAALEGDAGTLFVPFHPSAWTLDTGTQRVSVTEDHLALLLAEQIEVVVEVLGASQPIVGGTSRVDIGYIGIDALPVNPCPRPSGEMFTIGVPQGSVCERFETYTAYAVSPAGRFEERAQGASANLRFAPIGGTAELRVFPEGPADLELFGFAPLRWSGFEGGTFQVQLRLGEDEEGQASAESFFAVRLSDGTVMYSRAVVLADTSWQVLAAPIERDAWLGELGEVVSEATWRAALDDTGKRTIIRLPERSVRVDNAILAPVYTPFCSDSRSLRCEPFGMRPGAWAGSFVTDLAVSYEANDVYDANGFGDQRSGVLIGEAQDVPGDPHIEGPADFLGADGSDLLGQILDVTRRSDNLAAPAYDASLAGSGLVAVSLAATTHDGGWTATRIPLKGSAWRITREDGSATDRPATDADLARILAASPNLRLYVPPNADFAFQEIRVFRDTSTPTIPELRLTTEAAFAPLGDTLRVDVTVGSDDLGVTDLFGVGFSVFYDDIGLRLDRVDPGPFLGGDLLTAQTPENVKEAFGQVSYSVTRRGAAGASDGVDGTGVVATLVFYVEPGGGSDQAYSLTVADPLANDGDGSALSLVAGGGITVVTADLLTVWPGDTDDSGTVDADDVLAIARYFDFGGPGRGVADDGTFTYAPAWEPQLSERWDPTDATYADATGDGTVNDRDILPIGLNYGRVRSADAAPSARSKGAPLARLALPALKAGESAEFDLRLERDGTTGLAAYFTLPPGVSAGSKPGEVLDDGDLVAFDTATVAGESATAYASAFARKRGAFGAKAGRALRLVLTAETDIAPGQSVTLDRLTLASGEEAPRPADSGEITFATSVATESADIAATELVLAAPYPNPSRGAVQFAYMLPTAGDARLVLHDALGREVALLADAPHRAGTHTATLGQTLPAGVYFARLTTPSGTRTQRVVLLR